MGYALLIAPCLVCKKRFAMNPIRVPSFRVDGEKKPICQSCIEAINQERIKKGYDPFVIADDAYEGCDEMELG